VHAVKGAAEVWPAAQVLAAEAPAAEKVPTTVSFVQAETVVMVAAVAAAVVATLRVMVSTVKAVAVAPEGIPVPDTGQPLYIPVVLATDVRDVLPLAHVAVVVAETGTKPAVAEMVPAGQSVQPKLVPEPELPVPAVTYEYLPGVHRVHVDVVDPVVAEPEPAGQA